MSFENKNVIPGSKWMSSDYQKFQVISITEIDNNVWVHYRKCIDSYDQYQEYSCYLESFLSRFTEIINE